MSHELLHIQVDKITIPVSVRALTDKHVADLAESIKAEGLQTPINVFTTDKPGQYVLGAGGHRLAAVKSLGHKEIAALCLGPYKGVAAVRAAQLTENIQRENMTALEEAEAIEKQLDDRTEEQVANSLGRTLRWLRGRLALLALTAESRAALVAGDITLAHAVLLARVGDPKAQNDILDRVKGGGPRFGYRRPKKGSDTEYYPPSDAHYTSRLVDQVQRDLNKVPWRLDAEFGQCGACKGCPHNSANRGELFQDGQKNKICLNAPCFTDKNVTSSRAARRVAFYFRKLGWPLNPQNMAAAKAERNGEMVTDESVRAALKRIKAVKAAKEKPAGKEGAQHQESPTDKKWDIQREFKKQRKAWYDKAIEACIVMLRKRARAGAHLILLSYSKAWREADRHKLRKPSSMRTAFIKMLTDIGDETSLLALTRLVDLPTQVKRYHANAIDALLSTSGNFDNDEWDEPSGVVDLMLEAYAIDLTKLGEKPTEKSVGAKLFPPKPKAPPAKKASKVKMVPVAKPRKKK